ncbi:Cse1-domain-containing protein [Rhizopogon vinicolor AM-OR11-026]|uniref:Cse1-domain-containing protein n=1 Tax=Rhizopogon vinicolor AM-OR11-026 TaxID=1314800 RepID=A0A1B7MV61_9AGAM|nr:Cse1-domain-containing protein [Rhizopogon vinicolor AM-OR11-026]
MSDIASLLQASLQPASRKQAEQQLHALASQQGFLAHLLSLILNVSYDRPTRLAGGIYLKNVAKLRWEEDDAPIPEQDKTTLRSQLVPAMIALSDPADKTIRAQIAEAVALIAELDFPLKWSDLIDQLVLSLSPTDYSINVGVLQTAHSIFNQWRAQVRSDELFTEINFVLSRFMKPFLDLFNQTAALLLSSPTPSNIAIITQAQIILVDIFYDFTCQDLPPGIEDAHDAFFAPQTGLFQRFMSWHPAELQVDPDETHPSLPAQLKTRIFEIGELYIKLFPDQLSRSPAVEGFVQSVWELIGSNKLPGVADDALVSQSLRFISTAIRSGYYKSLFSSRDTIASLVQGVVIPNVGLRDHEMEQFEDEPLEFIRLDLAFGGSASEVATRRQAAADVLQALVSSGYQAEATEIVGSWITSGLQEYNSNPAQNWKAKDSAIYLLTAVATEASTTQHGVTSTNALVDVVKFFSEHVYQDLQASDGSVHAILHVDAIRFLLTFRNQLTREQLLSVLPLLVRHLNSDNYVTYTYAAITIDRILFIKKGTQLLFSQADIHDIAADLLNALLSKIEAAGPPEKVAENDHLMKCAMRIIVTARQTLTPVYQQILQRLVNVLGIIAKNPSNPNFDQYIFESISALLRFVVSGTPSTLPTFEQALFGPFTFILQQDIDQYIPYVFQILAQMLEAHTTGVPTEYRSLLPFLLTPTCWQQKGSIPGLVKLLKAFLDRDAAEMLNTGQIRSVLAVIQQRLIPSKINDGWGFELLQGVVQYVPPAQLKEYFKPLIMTLLTRMQTSKTDKYVYLFSHFLLFSMAIDVDGLGPDYVISALEEIQPQLWSQILGNFIIPQVPKMPHKDRKIAAVGLIRMLTQSVTMLTPPSAQSWPQAFVAVIKLFSEPQYLSKSKDEEQSTGLTEIDFEEQTAGYQAAYSRLAAAEGAPVDPVAYVRDPRDFLGQSLAKADPRVKGLLAAGDGAVVQPFVQALAASGYVIQ